MNDDDPRSRAILFQMIAGYRATAVIHAGAVLGIADLLREGARNIDDLARETGTHARSLHRLLRGLAVLGVLNEIETGSFELTPVGAPLRSDAPNSLHQQALQSGTEDGMRLWANLVHSARTGQATVEHVFGRGGFEIMAMHPERAAAFNKLMAEGTRVAASAIIGACDFSKFEQIVDVGGGSGTLLAAVLTAAASSRGVLFDTPTGVQGAAGVLEAASVKDRCRIVEGDFFESVPDGADAYILKSVIHDWDDERSMTILRNCRRAIPAHGKLIVVEGVLPPKVERSEPDRTLVMSDINMLVNTGGLERTEDEYRALLSDAGFAMTTVFPTTAPYPLSVIEARPT